MSASLPVAAGCGDGNGSDTGTTSSTTASTTSTAAGGTAESAAKVDIADFMYDPDPVTVKAGGTVTWTNDDPDEHTATSEDHTTFDTGTLEKGDSKTLTFAKPGTYAYVCKFHAFMHGTIRVVQ